MDTIVIVSSKDRLMSKLSPFVAKQGLDGVPSEIDSISLLLDKSLCPLYRKGQIPCAQPYLNYTKT